MHEYSNNQSALGRALTDTISAQRTAKFMWGGNIVLGGGGVAWLVAIAPNIAPWWELTLRAIIGGLGGLVTAFLFVLIWHLFRAPYKQRDEARAKLREWKQWTTFLKSIEKGSSIANKIINVPLLFQLKGIDTLANVTFEKCTFRGPCSVVFQGNTLVEGCETAESLEEVFIVISRERKCIGLVRFVHCKFKYCRFEAISFVGSKKTFDKWKANSVKL